MVFYGHTAGDAPPPRLGPVPTGVAYAIGVTISNNVITWSRSSLKESVTFPLLSMQNHFPALPM
ncbi:MAG TPA: hypothetical protein VN665_00600, partial [Candidatus Paceibacterota bacterium]|nr:hypothetical protein [Candidatus Paceibacterota bacterium]